ncbi:hypothetical protein BDN70DRAFT_863382 [Pholiota conissans]|uniref:O-fucosyltransferase family protein n=1 Tax=Pholiota conissans TaxID=109636 RepID=A0A9P5YX93_9AGAR|nr:hypothetical protein BDN70DRAFT_863382 [Pholiota conissans]
MTSLTKSFQYASSDVGASPGVSLERGNYRMRAPNIRPLPAPFKGHAIPVRRSTQRRRNRRLAFLIMLLAASCLSCFGYAYYLFSTRWAARPITSLKFPTDSIAQATGSELLLDRTQKYLSYLPHSGFHNQRIAFENALLLAYALRRTLLVPPIRLSSKPIRYIEYDTLSRYHEISDKKGLKHCPQIPKFISRPSECLHYFESSFIPWTLLVNLSTVTAHQALYHLPNMSRSWIHANFDIGSNDFHTLRDISAYQFRFVDDVNDPSPRGKYEIDVSFDQLNAIPEKLLQIGTLFGTGRLHLRNSGNLAYQAAIRQSMMFTNEMFSQAANSIARVLQPSYLAVHIRAGDGLFQSIGEHTVNSTWWKILHDVLALSIPDICKLELSFGTQASSSCILGRAGSDSSTPTPIGSPKTLFSVPSPLETDCMGNRYLKQQYHQLNVPLYVATDLSTPRTHPLLNIFRQTFPCIFFLEDFKSELAPLKQVTSPYDAVQLYNFILPYVDALVAGNALKVVGTEGSTFSKFIEDILWASKFYQGDASR